VTFVASGRRNPEADLVDVAAAMRGVIPGLASPRPIGAELPSVLQEDDFCQRMMGALDEVLAPVFSSLDCFDSYLDPELAPPDFVDWLAGWVGIDIDETWSLERRRHLIQDAAVLYRVRGTAAGLAAHVRLYAGVTPEIVETGGCGWSQTPDSPLPGSARPHLTVRLRVDGPGDVRRNTVNRIVAGSRPAHVPYDLELIVGGDQIEAPGDETPEPEADVHAPGAIDLPGSEHIELAPQAPPSQEELDESTDRSPDDSEPTS
jgi:phage tail-like protein